MPLSGMLPKCLTVLCCRGLSPQASICRSSQPLSGFSARCLEDEQMLQAIRKANPRSDFIYVVDTRPKVSVDIFVHVSAALRPEAGRNQSLTDINHCSWSDETWGNQGAASDASQLLKGLSVPSMFSFPAFAVLVAQYMVYCLVL